MIVLAIAAIAMGVVDVYTVELYFKKMLREPQNKAHLRSRCIYTSEAVKIEVEDGSAHSFPWSSFVNIEQLGDDYLLYVSKHNALIVLRSNHSEENWVQLTGWAEQWHGRLAAAKGK